MSPFGFTKKQPGYKNRETIVCPRCKFRVIAKRSMCNTCGASFSNLMTDEEKEKNSKSTVNFENQNLKLA